MEENTNIREEIEDQKSNVATSPDDDKKDFFRASQDDRKINSENLKTNNSEKKSKFESAEDFRLAWQIIK